MWGNWLVAGPLRLPDVPLSVFAGASGSKDSSAKVGCGALGMTFLGRDGEKDFLEVTELGRERRNHICQSDLPSWESTTTQRPFEGVCVYGGSDAPSGKGGWSQRPYLPRKGMHPSFLPSSRSVRSRLRSLSCLPVLLLEDVCPGAIFGRTPPQFLLTYLSSSHRVRICFLPCFTEVSTGGCCVCLWYIPLKGDCGCAPGLLPLCKRSFQMGCLSDTSLNLPFLASGCI